MATVISYLIPERSYEFFRELVSALEDRGIAVEVNKITSRSRLVLAAILPCTPEWYAQHQWGQLPFVLWHWDLYSFVDLSKPAWARFIELLPRASEVWSCGYEVARQLKERFEIDSHVMPAWVDQRNLRKLPTKDFAYYAAGPQSIGKRLDWAEKACAMLNLSLRSHKDGFLLRRDYFKTIAECRVYLMTAFEESNGSIPTMEAAACGKPVVMADLPASREVFGDGAFYFKPWDFADCVAQLKSAWTSYVHVPSPQHRILRNYELQVIADRITERIKHVIASV